MSRSFVLILCALYIAALAGCDAGKSTPSASSSAAGAPGGPDKSATTPTVPAGAGARAPQPVTPRPKDRPLRVGVTLHPYYSWTANVAGAGPEVEVRSILPGDVDAGNYQPRPEDIQKLADLDAIVVNGIGHDDFINDMIRASGNQDIVIIRPNDDTPTIRAAHGGEINSHTFISFTNAVQQSYAIARVLGQLRPDLADRFQANAQEYAKRLRAIKADAATKLTKAKVTRVVTVHDGYAYICQEFGLEVAGVVEPAHGLVPSAQELGATVDLIKNEKIDIVLSEESFPEDMLAVLEKAGARVYVISHIASGEYTPDKFEKEMQKNADTLVQALVTD